MCASRIGAVEKGSVVAISERNRGAVKWRMALVTLSSTLAVCFLLLGRFEPRFFFIHAYEALIYVAIVLMVFAGDDRWLHAFGMLAPAGWLLLSVFTSGFGSVARQLEELLHFQEPNHGAIVLGTVIGGLSLVTIGAAASGWRRWPAAQTRSMQILLIAFAIVTIYDAGLLLWSLRAAQHGF